MKKIIFSLCILLSTFKLSAHSDFIIDKTFGNIHTSITTGYDFEDIYKLEIAGQLAEKLSEKIGNKTRLFISYSHQYTSLDFNTVYWVSYGEADVYDGEKWKKEDGLIIRVKSNELDIESILKLTEFAFSYEEQIKTIQTPVVDTILLDKPFKIDAIDSSIVDKVLDKKPSKNITEVMANKIYRSKKIDGTDILYYLQNGKYHIVKQYNNGVEEELAVFDNVYQICADYIGFLVFETRDCFTYMIYNGARKIHKKHFFDSVQSWHPYEMHRIDHALILIYFSSWKNKYPLWREYDNGYIASDLIGFPYKVMFYSPFYDTLTENGRELIFESLEEKNPQLIEHSNN